MLLSKKCLARESRSRARLWSARARRVSLSRGARSFGRGGAVAEIGDEDDVVGGGGGGVGGVGVGVRVGGGVGGERAAKRRDVVAREGVEGNASELAWERATRR